MKKNHSVLHKSILLVALLALTSCASTQKAGSAAGNGLRKLNPFKERVVVTETATADEGASDRPKTRRQLRREADRQWRKERRETRTARQQERETQRLQRRDKIANSNPEDLSSWQRRRIARASERQRVRDGREAAKERKVDAIEASYGKTPADAEKTRRGIFSVYPFMRQRGDAASNLVLKERAWTRIVKRTDVRLIGDDRIRIDVKSPYVMSVEDMEFILLGRAAGEAYRAGYPNFSIVYARYKGGEGLGGLLMPQFNYATSDWIGSYEGLVRERENQRLTGNYNKVGAKKIEAVVRFIGTDSRRRRNSFTADELYLNMLNERLFDGDYPYDNN